MAVNPWSSDAGSKTASGSYLSPTNAIEDLTAQLSQAGGDKDIVIIMLTAPSSEGFIGQMQQLAQAFPLPVVGQACRMAQTQLTLQVSKMQLPARALGGLPAPAALSVSTVRQIAGAHAIAQAAASAGGDIEALSAAITQFKAARAAALSHIQQVSTALQQNICPVWSFCYSGDIQTARIEMKKDIPHPDHVFTLAMMFVGDNLAPLRGLLS
ncbi:MAG: hypothetical protein RR987_16670 [Hafnia sp.]